MAAFRVFNRYAGVEMNLTATKDDRETFASRFVGEGKSVYFLIKEHRRGRLLGHLEPIATWIGIHPLGYKEVFRLGCVESQPWMGCARREVHDVELPDLTCGRA